MASVSKVKARKDYPKFGIKKGEEHYVWSINFVGTFRSKTPPKQSQLTSSPFLQEYYSIQEELEAMAPEDAEDLKSQVEEIVSRIENLRDETQGSFDNMPEGLQQGDTGQLLEERVSGLDDWLSNLEGVDLDFEFDEDEPAEPTEKMTDEEIEEAKIAHEEWETRKEEAEKDFVQEKLEEIQSFDPGL